MQRSLEYYFKGESSGVAAVSGSSSGLQKREKEKVMINVLFTKRRSIIAPKSRDNYPYTLNVRNLRYFFWLFNSKLYGSYQSNTFLYPVFLVGCQNKSTIGTSPDPLSPLASETRRHPPPHVHASRPRLFAHA